MRISQRSFAKQCQFLNGLLKIKIFLRGRYHSLCTGYVLLDNGVTEQCVSSTIVNVVNTGRFNTSRLYLFFNIKPSYIMVFLTIYIAG